MRWKRHERMLIERDTAMGFRERLNAMNSPAQITGSNPSNQRRHSWGYFVGLAVMGIFYILAGSNHFASPTTYLSVVPPYIPWPLTMIYISGVAEILGGIGLFVPDGFVFPRTRAAAAWGLVALLIAVYPVHINMCLHPDRYSAIQPWILWLRLFFQLPLIAWAWYYTRMLRTPNSLLSRNEIGAQFIRGRKR